MWWHGDGRGPEGKIPRQMKRTDEKREQKKSRVIITTERRTIRKETRRSTGKRKVDGQANYSLRKSEQISERGSKGTKRPAATSQRVGTVLGEIAEGKEKPFHHNGATR